MEYGNLNEQELLDNIGKIAYTLDKKYLSELTMQIEVNKKSQENDSKDEKSQEYVSKYWVHPFDEYNKEDAINYENNIRALQIDKWVFDKKEKPGECFKNVMSAFADGDHSIAVVLKRTPNDTKMYLVVKNEGIGRSEESGRDLELLEGALKGSFPGTSTKLIENGEEIKKFFSFDDKISIDNNDVEQVASIATLVNTPSEYSEEYISQGIDKLVNGIVPKDDKESYSVIFLAESLAQNDIREILSGFEDMATAINPFLQYQFQMGSNEMETNGETTSLSKSSSITDSIFKTHSVNIDVNSSVSKSRTTSTSASVNAGAVIKGVVNVGASVATALARTFTKTIGISAGYGYSWGKSKAITNGQTETSGKSNSMSIGKSENTTYTYKSYMVSNLIEKLEKTISRIKLSQGTGLWKYSTYVLANNSATSRNVANYLKAITQGKESYIEPAVIQEWMKEDSNRSTNFDEIKKYLSHFTHPLFVTTFDENATNAMMVTPTSYVATNELSNVIAFPRKSVPGIPVLECTEFGRNVISYDGENESNIELGKIYHMHHEEENTAVNLDKNSLTSHVFITGSTGAGKSNTVFKILDEVIKDQTTKFLVIEPAKGEYKSVFGGREDVKVYGTNYKKCNLLKINPFSFPDDILVSEHIDRLIEIFNACWPMYAAMPAILKDAVIRAYEKCGWDIGTSENTHRIFPNFFDVLTEIRAVLNESEYSSDNKGDYTGALVTRLKSLINGINGQIFNVNEISDKDLFDENVIVDLSLVGSPETKSLIMGFLMMKLQEYRLASGLPDNSDLKHITVLEEAHNLLKRTSYEQSSESSNLIGKSVEMIANSIAELRSFGEGFIIADQSPGLLDMSVIRNTNTKIIHRLPDFSDRELVGRAATLNEEQIKELAKLARGVAAIYQNDWINPVLCKVAKFDERNEKKYKYSGSDNESTFDAKMFRRDLLELILKGRIVEQAEPNIDSLKNQLKYLETSTKYKLDILALIDEYESTGKLEIWEDENFAALSELVTDLVSDKAKIEASVSAADSYEKLTRLLIDQIRCSTYELSEEIEISVCQCFMKNFSNDNSEVKLGIYAAWRESIRDSYKVL